MPTVYMLKCADGTIYTGYTFDMEKRLAAHNAGVGAKYTRSRLPVNLLWSCELPTARQVRSAEVYIKRLTRADKLRLAAGELSLAEACPKLVVAAENVSERESEKVAEVSDL